MDDRLPARAAPAPGERWVVRRRLADGSATDVIGWVEEVAAEVVVLTDAAGTTHRVPLHSVIAARRAPAARGGPDPRRASAREVERVVMSGWLDQHQALGDWVLRAAAGFTRTANSCLAVGDPGRPIHQAVAAILDWSARHGITPLARVVVGSEEEAGLGGLSWRPAGGTGQVLVGRLSALLTGTAPAERLLIEEELSPAWLSTYAASRGADPDAAVLRRLLEGRQPRGFAASPATGSPRAIGRGEVTGAWLGLRCLWSEPGQREPLSSVVLGLGQWGARRGARNVYVQVPADDTEALAAYAAMALTPHHEYVYLAPNGQGGSAVR
jgi:N-acetylglutamate synthase